ncbi:MAG: hypothetical protein ACTSUD_07710, partial [Alphaproteobacteria bacterium]
MRTLIVAAVAAMGMTGIAIAIADEAKGPTVMTDAQMDLVVAGAGRDNVAIVPWDALFAAGFVPTHHAAADKGVIDHAGHLGVIVPRRP